MKLAQEADERQAEQNRQIAHQNHQIAEATKQLVEADAKSRQELVALERDLQAERAAIGHARDDLENERKTLSNERKRESLLVELLQGSMTLAACLLPLVLCWYLLHGLRKGDADETLGDVLTIELASDSHSPLLPPPGDCGKPDGYLPSGHDSGTDS